jgi:hypothetical protein
MAIPHTIIAINRQAVRPAGSFPICISFGAASSDGHACVPDRQMTNRVGVSSRIWSYTIWNMDDVNEQTYTVSSSILITPCLSKAVALSQSGEREMQRMGFVMQNL